jgi:hypothetical protein
LDWDINTHLTTHRSDWDIDTIISNNLKRINPVGKENRSGPPQLSSIIDASHHKHIAKNQASLLLRSKEKLLTTNNEKSRKENEERNTLIDTTLTKTLVEEAGGTAGPPEGSIRTGGAQRHLQEGVDTCAPSTSSQEGRVFTRTFTANREAAGTTRRTTMV